MGDKNITDTDIQYMHIHNIVCCVLLNPTEVNAVLNTNPAMLMFIAYSKRVNINLSFVS